MATSVRSRSSLSGNRPKAVGAIDFGTCNTRIAFGMRPTDEKDGKFRVQLVTEWEDSKGNPDMAPTSILFSKAKEVVAYGFAAEQKFKNDVGEDYYFFRNFKMDLHSKEVSFKVHSNYCLQELCCVRSLLTVLFLVQTFSPEQPIRAANKGTMPAIQVFSAALRYLSEKLVKFIKNTVENSGVENVGDIQWVLTVPAIWKPGARHFMRKAAYEVCKDFDRHVCIARRFLDIEFGE